MHPTLHFDLHGSNGVEKCEVDVRRAIVAGWTARDKVAMQAHIDELAEHGVAPPKRTPIYYRVAAARLTQADAIEVTGPSSSGEAEFILVNIDGDIWVGAGSDHTDRAAEAHGVTLSKQMCDKPLARSLWKLDDVIGHWDKLELTSWIMEKGARVVYQKGPVTTMLSPADLMKGFAAEDEMGGLGTSDVMMCGTLPAIGGVRPSSRFAFELKDPVLVRSMAHGYDIIELPVHG
ncbi:MAG: DUF2848 domain-containing protein [Hyphomicrobiaceae bacterium]|nr:DUF2848 domain-containing protein [Hyphomicrobiaceae bacterium]